MENAPKTIGERDSFNKTSSEDAASFETRRFEYLVQRRDVLMDRIRFGALTLNGASLVGLLAALGGTGQAATWLGFSQNVALWSAGFFATGVLAAGIAILLEANRCTLEAGDAFARQTRASLFKASHSLPFSDESIATHKRLMDDYHAAPNVDFGYSKPANIAQSLSTSCWVTGMAFPFLNSLGLISENWSLYSFL